MKIDWSWIPDSPWFPFVAALLLSTLILLAGCAGARPYVEAGAGYQIFALSDWWYDALRDHPNGNQLGQPWVFRVQGGWEFPRNIKCGWEHESRLLDGAPFNNNAELYRETIVCSKKFGGF